MGTFKTRWDSIQRLVQNKLETQLLLSSAYPSDAAEERVFKHLMWTLTGRRKRDPVPTGFDGQQLQRAFASENMKPMGVLVGHLLAAT
jgi:hypothetical protein